MRRIHWRSSCQRYWQDPAVVASCPQDLCAIKILRSSEPLTRCHRMSKTVLIKQTTTLGGRITCRRCQVISSSGLQCRRGAMKNRVVCHGHSELPKGPRTPEGRQRCASAKYKGLNESRRERTKRALGMRRLRELEDLGHLLGFMVGPKTPGRKPCTSQNQFMQQVVPRM